MHEAPPLPTTVAIKARDKLAEDEEEDPRLAIEASYLTLHCTDYN